MTTKKPYQSARSLMTRQELLNEESVVHLKIDILLQKSTGRFNESSRWCHVRSAMDSKYPSFPDVMAGFYILVEVGNGGRELAIRDHDGNEFLVHQDHAEIIL